MNRKHSPLPWAVGMTGERELSIASLKDRGDGSTALVCLVSPPNNTTAVDEANAEFIVTACNNHYALVEALEYVVKDVLPRCSGYGEADDEAIASADKTIRSLLASIKEASK